MKTGDAAKMLKNREIDPGILMQWNKDTDQGIKLTISCDLVSNGFSCLAEKRIMPFPCAWPALNCCNMSDLNLLHRA